MEYKTGDIIKITDISKLKGNFSKMVGKEKHLYEIKDINLFIEINPQQIFKGNGSYPNDHYKLPEEIIVLATKEDFKNYLEYIIFDKNIALKVNDYKEQVTLMTLLDKYKRYSPSEKPWLDLLSSSNASFPLYLIYDSYFKYENNNNSYGFYPKEWLDKGNSIVDMKDIKLMMSKIYGI